MYIAKRTLNCWFVGGCGLLLLALCAAVTNGQKPAAVEGHARPASGSLGSFDLLAQSATLAEDGPDEKSSAAELSIWLDSPFHPNNMLRWLSNVGPKLVLILLVTYALRTVAVFISRRFGALIVRTAPGSPEERHNRATTLAAAFRYSATATIVMGGALLALQAAGMNITTLLGGAAVIGLAVAFGAQSLLKDYFCGFIILLENQYSINDVVKIGEFSGVVERITLRMTALRDLEGHIHFIPNGNIGSVTNMTQSWSRAVFEIGVAYKEEVDTVINVLVDLGRELRADPEFADAILEDLEMLGVDAFADSAIIIKFVIKTLPRKQWKVKREMLRRIKKRFAEEGIEIPFPHRIIQHQFPNGQEQKDIAKVLGESERTD